MTAIRKKKVLFEGLSGVSWALLAPAILILAAVVVYPLIYEIDISFRNITLLNIKSGKYPWVWFDNYVQIFSDAQFYFTAIRTVLWTIVNVTAHVIGGFLFALVLNRKLPGKVFFRTILILPWAVPQYIAAIAWRNLFQYEYGAINIILVKVFGEGAMIPWLADAQWAFRAAIITNIWLGIPFMMMIALGGMQSIPTEMFEASEIDGANAVQRVTNITIPMLRPIMTPAIVLGTVWTFNMVNVIYILTYGSTHEASQILVTMVYKRAFEFFRYGYGAALSIIIFLILLSFSSVFIKAQKLED